MSGGVEPYSLRGRLAHVNPTVYAIIAIALAVMAGNARPAAITTIDTVYQQIKVPQGTSTIEFGFEPPHVSGLRW